MAEIGLSVAAKVAEYVVEPVLNRARLVFSFKSIVDEFQKEYVKLRLRQDRVQNKVREARNNTQIIEKDVEKWLAEVSSVVEDVQLLLRNKPKLKAGMEEDHVMQLSQTDQSQDIAEDERRVGKRRVRVKRWCTIWSSCRYKLSKKLAEKTTVMKKLLEDGKFDRVGHPAPLVDLELFSEDFVMFEPTSIAFNRIMNALKNDGVNMIGLYGIGGSGKTTLAKQVGKKAQELKIFDRAIVVSVSLNSEIRRMQSKIADLLSMKLDQESDEGRASKLNLRLKNEKILIILDDVWKKFDLSAIGIDSDCKGCKILFTTRRLQVCHLMKSQESILLETVSQDEAWAFFSRKAGVIEGSNLSNVAKRVAGECKGLLIALATLGATLRNRSLKEWEDAYIKLKYAKLVDIAGIDDAHDINVYKCLRLSYDYLKDPAEAHLQILFLLCALFPEDHEIDIEDLVRYAFGVELFEHVESIEDARTKVHVAVHILKDSCLLLSTEKEHIVKMHDMIRDVAIWIGSTESTERSVFAITDGKVLKNMKKKRVFENCRAIPFMSESLPELFNHEHLECPKLEILLIFEGDGQEHAVLSDALFKDMEALKVLDFRAYARRGELGLSLPQSLQHATNLRALNMRRYHFLDISIVGELKSLEILSFEGSCFDCGLDAMGALDQLKLLDLSYAECPRMLDSKVISKLLSLEELYIVGDASNAIVSELKSLSNLVILSMELKNIMFLPIEFFFEDLERYDISVGRENVVENRYPTSRALYVGRVWSLNAFKNLLPRVQHLDLSNPWLGKGFKNIIPYIDEGGLKELISLKLHDIDAITYLVNTTSGASVAFPELLELCLANMKSLRALCQGPPPYGYLHKLQKITLSDCEELSNAIFPEELAWRVQKLEELEAIRCNKVEIVFETDEENYETVMACLRVLKLECLPALSRIWKGPARNVSFSSLRYVTVSDCNRLKRVFTTGIARNLQQLKELRIQRCNELKQVMVQSVDDDNFGNVVFHELWMVTLTDLPLLESFCPSSCDLSLPLLESWGLKVEGCPNFNPESISNQ